MVSQLRLYGYQFPDPTKSGGGWSGAHFHDAVPVVTRSDSEQGEEGHSEVVEVGVLPEALAGVTLVTFCEEPNADKQSMSNTQQRKWRDTYVIQFNKTLRWTDKNLRHLEKPHT